jgi:hypothetical protein
VIFIPSVEPSLFYQNAPGKDRFVSTGLTFGWLHVMPIKTSLLYKVFFFGIDFSNLVTESIMASIIDGKAVAKEVQKHIKEEIEGLERRWGMVPGLGVVLVGDDPGSHIYVKNKERACKEVGIKSYEHLLAATVSERELLTLVHSLNKDKNVHGILVQLPLPAHIQSARERCYLAVMALSPAPRWGS